MKKAARLLFVCSWVLGGCGAENTASPHVPAAYPETSSRGYAVLVEACATCHAPPHPEVHTAREWSWVVHRMEAHRIQRGLGAIADTDRNALLSYLTRHAGRPS